MELLRIIESKERFQINDLKSALCRASNSLKAYDPLDNHITLQDPALSAYLRAQNVNKNDKLKIKSTTAESNETTIVSKENVTSEDGGSTKTAKTTQQKIKSLKFTTDDQCQAYLRTF